MADRIRIAVVYGGRSSEHPISVVSAGSVLGALDRSRYDVVMVGITRSGSWRVTDDDGSSLQIEGRSLPEVADSEVAVGPDVEVGGSGVELFSSRSGVAALGSVDVVLPLLHGTYGEDGTIQGLFEMAGIPYVGSGVLASAAGMDKAFTKIVLAAAGLNVGRYLVHHRGDEPDLKALAELGLPLFVKPARSGSSVGVSKVRDLSELEAAMELAFVHDSKILIEAAVLGREIECGVLQDADGTVSASLPAEIRLHADFDWYDFDAKYLDDASDFDIPAVLDPDALAAVQRGAVAAFRALECRGLARVDFFIDEQGELIVNEINTMPGFTPISMYPRMWAASGVEYPELVDRLVATALAKP